jgi:hypothetical protein
MAITTAMATSFKSELMQASHCFNAPPGSAPTGNTTSASTSVTSVSSLTGISVGQKISGTGIPVNTVIAALPSTSSLTLSIAATATNTGTTFTLAGDVFNIALIKSGMAGTYGATTSNYSAVTGNSDEVSGTGYTAGGLALGNVTPTNDGASVAWTSFSPNPSWAGATFSTAGCIIYSTSARNAGVTGRAISVHDFQGVQSVSSGTLTILIPSATNTTALLRLS